jgi:hypothetical protein
MISVIERAINQLPSTLISSSSFLSFPFHPKYTLSQFPHLNSSTSPSLSPSPPPSSTNLATSRNMYPTSSRRLYVALANDPFPTQRGWYHLWQPSQDTRVGSPADAWQWQCGPKGGELGGRAVLIARAARSGRRFRWEAEEGVVVVGFRVSVSVVVVFVGDVVGDVVGVGWFIGVRCVVWEWVVVILSCRDDRSCACFRCGGREGEHRSPNRRVVCPLRQCRKCGQVRRRYC